MALSAGAGGGLSPARWQLVVLALHRALTLTLRPLRQLMAAFRADSDNFYGDMGQVKVAARRDCTGRESDRLRQLAHQVSTDHYWVSTDHKYHRQCWFLVGFIFRSKCYTFSHANVHCYFKWKI